MENTHTQIKFYIPKGEKDTINKFLDAYDFENILLTTNSNLYDLRKKSERICVFCGRNCLDTTFKNIAHLIPEFLGNKKLFSDIECDQCNNYFGVTYEKHLADYLGIYRTLSKIPNKKKYPTFKSPGDIITARVQKVDGYNSVHISRQDPNDNSIDLNIEKGLLSITYEKNPYVPNRAYKALLKIALSFINTEEVFADYDLALKYLASSNNKVLNGCFLTGIHLPFNISISPYLLLYKKKDVAAELPTHVMALYFYNTVLCIPIPLNKRDLFFHGKEISLFNCPPIFLYPIDFDNNKMTSFSTDMSSLEVVKGEKEIITAEFNPEDFQNLKAFNLDTMTNDDNAQFDPSSIISIMIMDKEIQLDLSKLRQPPV